MGQSTQGVLDIMMEEIVQHRKYQKDAVALGMERAFVFISGRKKNRRDKSFPSRAYKEDKP